MPAGAGSYLDSGQSCSCRRGEYNNVLQLHWHAAGVFMITTLGSHLGLRRLSAMGIADQHLYFSRQYAHPFGVSNREAHAGVT
jgi:hypothetical protein